VPVDHWVLLSTDQAPTGWGHPVGYPTTMRHSLRAFLPPTVMGRHYGRGQSLPNGDFTITHDALLAADPTAIGRRVPTARR
jgi:hypothetical protein